MEGQLAADIVKLPGELPLPPIDVSKAQEQGNGVAEHKGLGYSGTENGGFEMPSKLQGASPRKGDAVAPYQALPVTSEVITEHLTPALPVLEPSELEPEV